MKFVSGRSLFPYRALKLTFPRDIGGLTQDGTMMDFGFMSQTIGVLTLVIFNLETQQMVIDLRLVSLNARGLKSNSKSSQHLSHFQLYEVDICCLQETTLIQTSRCCQEFVNFFQPTLTVVLEGSPS